MQTKYTQIKNVVLFIFVMCMNHNYTIIGEPDDVDKGDRCGQTVTSIQDPNNQDKQVGRDDLHSQRMQAKQPDRIEQIEQLPPTESDVHVSGQNKNDVLGQNEEAVLVNHDQDMYRHRYHHSNSRCVMPESSHGSAALREVSIYKINTT